MNTKLFVGLTFFSDNSFAKNIESFRARFDEKYQMNPYLHLPIVPPFEVEVTSMKKLTQELIEELESFYFENTSYQMMKFTGLDVQEFKKNKVLFLNPLIEEELSYCQESLVAICRTYLADRQTRMKDFKKTFLTIGRFQDAFNLHQAIGQAQSEFHEFASLPYESISLFSKNIDKWVREADLITFDRPAESFLHSSPVNL